MENTSVKIVIVNGSHRKNGATAGILNEMCRQLKKCGETEGNDVAVEMIHAADLELKYCVGCGSCYQTGECIYKDDMEELSLKIGNADGVIFGSPTYASNVSGQMKVMIDRGHFVMEQQLYGKYAISVATYENYGGRDCAKVLKRLFTYSGAKISGIMVVRNGFDKNPLEDIRLKRNVEKTVNRFYRDISGKRKYVLQTMKHFMIFRMGIRPFVLRKGTQYGGVIRHWKECNIIVPRKES